MSYMTSRQTYAVDRMMRAAQRFGRMSRRSRALMPDGLLAALFVTDPTWAWQPTLGGTRAESGPRRPSRRNVLAAKRGAFLHEVKPWRCLMALAKLPRAMPRRTPRDEVPDELFASRKPAPGPGDPALGRRI